MLLAVLAIVIALMSFEHLARLLDVVSISGRKTYVVAQSMVALLPEYAGVGLLFGLFLAIALTTRRLSLRGELDVIQATGISTFRWMRIPALLAVSVAALMLLDQGWLMPLGELRVSELGREMKDGQFGYDLEAGQFIDLGNGLTLKFEAVDPSTSDLRGVFLRTAERTFTASRGHLGFGFAQRVLIDLDDGNALNDRDGESLSFSRFHFDSGKGRDQDDSRVAAADRRKGMSLPALLSSSDLGDSAAAFSRMLWPGFALLIPALATTLGKPMRRSNSWFGLALGLVLLVAFIRCTGMVAADRSAHPALSALLTIGVCVVVAWGISRGERKWGPGYVDHWLQKTVGRMKPKPSAAATSE